MMEAESAVIKEQRKQPTNHRPVDDEPDVAEMRRKALADAEARGRAAREARRSVYDVVETR